MGSMGIHVRVAVILCLLMALVMTTESRGLASNSIQDVETGRSLTEGSNSSEHLKILERTERVDPLDKFKKYKGGYNITNKHYWSSVIFTGIYGYSVAVLWLLGGAIYTAGLLIISTFTENGRKDVKGVQCRRTSCFLPMTVAISLTLLAVVASGVALAGSSEFYSTANSVKTIIAETAEEASTTIYNVTGAVKTMQADTELYGKIKGSTRLSSTSERLNGEASKIQRKAGKTVRLIGKGLKILRATTLVIVSLNLVIVIALLVSGFLRFHQPFHILLLLCWLLTFFFWIYFGLYFFLYGFAGDTCMALGEYRQNPHNSSLSSILPCNDLLSAKSALQDTRAGIHDLIDQVNANISALQQSSTLPNLAIICNPFSQPPEYKYQPGNCSGNEIQIGDIPRMLKRYTCLDSAGEGTCRNGEFISASVYNRVMVYTTTAQNLLNSFPGMERIVNCQIVKDAFSEILTEQCGPLRKYARMSWASMVVLSTVMVVLLVIWAVVARHHGKHHSSGGSVKPQSAMAA